MSGTIVVTAQEIQDAPVINNPAVERKPAERSKFNLVLCIVLGINTLFQFIALVTPGWKIITLDKSSQYESVYYFRRCVTLPKSLLGDIDDTTTECTSQTFLKSFQDKYELAGESGKATLGLAYNIRVRYQINIQLSWFAVVGTTVFQIIKYAKANEAFPKLTTINTMALMCVCCAMYQVLYEAFAEIDFLRKTAEYGDFDVGFSYSVFFYALAFVQTCASTLIIAKQIFDYMRYLQCSLAESQVKYDTMKKHYEAENEGLKRLRIDNTHLRPGSRGSYADNKRSGDYSPKHSTRPSPRPSPGPSPTQAPRHSDNRSNARYRELLERSRGNNHDTADSRHNHFFPADEHPRRPRDHSPRPRDHSPPHDHSPRTHDQFPGPRDYSPRDRERSPGENDQYQNQARSDRGSSPAPADPLLSSKGPVYMSQEKSDTVPTRQAKRDIDYENIDLTDNVV